ncbi:uncharacterized protein N7498_001540 [Penicillium cinerascens]|uniref:chitinase n=1 Tax=Penicillium cinerascens TaxID=70096 RepID=A0A9W9TEA6_9EURO|nr:uncharacterized protein N7498_001540 [Penicillium cinerascens]KAJ5219441.1 hypothetical protein N7498_001540 [Penicillium cinerascens]
MQMTFNFLAIATSFAWLVTALPPELNEFFAHNPLSIVTRASQTSGSPTLSRNGVLQTNPALVRAANARCPVGCFQSGSNPGNWTVYHSVDRLSWCNETMLLDFALFNPLDDPETQKSIRACTAGDSPQEVALTDTSCAKLHDSTEELSASLHIAFVKSSSSASASSLVSVTGQLQSYVAQKSGCDQTIAFATTTKGIVGLYAGSEIQRQGLVSTVLTDFATVLKDMTTSDTVLVQLCGESLNNRYMFGVIASAQGDLSAIQNVVQTWSKNECVTSYGETSVWQNITVRVPTAQHVSKSSGRTTTKRATASRVARGLHPRSTCSTVQVHSGDDCVSVAAECGITVTEFKEYNPGSDICSPLPSGRHVCCSSGTLPNFARSPDANGTCAAHTVNGHDTCSAIAASYDITVADLENWNKNTWGWMGCSDLQVGSYMCISTGSAPMPAPLANAVCGPQVPGTAIATAGTNLSTLNECPLNACCDIWGQCGTTDEFCVITESTTGAPGTAAARTNGCISNCGTAIVQSDAPAEFMKVAYWEAFDQSRPCLNSPVSTLADSDYTHVHLAFAEVTSDFKVNVSGISDQFNTFMSLGVGWKKILSFEGWDFSTNPDTYNIFRQAVTEDNRATFASNIVEFVRETGLDGVDFDWEYPGEPDIRGIPAGSEEDGFNYFMFLDELANQFLKTVPGTTISVAAPASFWYLQNFPIEAIGMITSYIIFMTYDLHGQWDYSKTSAQSGCPFGDCLRSDVNLTETINALSMITKAGVPSNKVVVGVTSYGRSFQMTEAGCSGPMCTYTGPASGAYKGPCTGTAGYLANAEIAYANATLANPAYTFDTASYSDILVFDETQWVAWMEDANKAVRRSLYMGMNFGGTTDWAVDLQGDASTITSECDVLIASDGTSFPICASPTPQIGCIEGTGSGNYQDLCEFSCQYDYCPSPFCNCTATGTVNPVPLETSLTVCPVSDLDASFISLCDFDCKYGHCPSKYCATATGNELYGCGNAPSLIELSANISTSNPSCQDVGAGMY